MDERLMFLFKRRSIRAFHRDKPVEEKDIKALLEAGMAAPSARNLKPWHFIVVTDREMLDKLSVAHIELLSLIAIGHPAEEKEPRTQYDETRVHRERW